MLKRHSLILSIILSLYITSGIGLTTYALPDNPPETVQTQAVETNNFDDDTSNERVKVKDLDIDPLDTVSLRKSVVPDPKQEGKKVVGLFIKSMLAVALCGIFVYAILFFAKRFFGGYFISKEYNKEVESLDLSTPETKEDAFKSFLNRTK